MSTSDTFDLSNNQSNQTTSTSQPEQKTTVSDQLLDWVKQCQEQGETSAQIFRRLLEAGHSQKIASQAMDGFLPKLKLAPIRNADDRLNRETSPSNFYALANIDLIHKAEVQQIEDDRVQLFLWPNFLSTDKCEQLIQDFDAVFAESTVVDQDIYGNHGHRTSSTVYLAEHSPEVNDEIVQLAADAMGVDTRYCEGSQIQRYQKGQEFKTHPDYFSATSPSFLDTLGSMGQRTWTCVLYLNDNFTGGNTKFDRIGQTISPTQGAAAFWNNLTPSGQVNEFSMHTGCPIESGTKYIVTIWFRERPQNTANLEGTLKVFEQEFQAAKQTPCDIHEHLDTLYQYAKAVDHITEFGVRTGMSSRAFLAANKPLRSYDLFLDDRVSQLFRYAKSNGMDVEYTESDVLNIEIDSTDLLFIDTWHCYEQVRSELHQHANKVRKYIIFHDTQTFGTVSEKQPLETDPSGVSSYREGSNGILPAIIEFIIQQQGRWGFKEHKTNNNGLTIIERFY